jgi:hypothetical protein
VTPRPAPPTANDLDPGEIHRGIALMPSDPALLVAIAGQHDDHHEWARSLLWAQRSLARSAQDEHAFRIVIHSLIATNRVARARRAFASFGEIAGVPLLLD